MPARYVTLANWVLSRNWSKGAELGIFDGRTHLFLLKSCPQLELIGVDVWDLPGFREGPSKSGERCFCDYCNETRRGRKRETAAQMRARVFEAARGYGERSKLFQMPTDRAATLVLDHSLDFLFIDGDHSTEGVTADIRHWQPKLKSGGWLIGHDYNLRCVREAVLAVFESKQVVTTDDHVWFVVV